jgi:hypothetical protein
MTELDQIITKAYQNEGKKEDVNKVYLTFLQTLLYVPVKKDLDPTLTDEPFAPLFTKIENQTYMLVFDTVNRLKNWANDAIDQMNYVELSGHDVIFGIHPEVYLCLNVGTQFYKEFSPDEVFHLKKIVAKIQTLKNNPNPS